MVLNVIEPAQTRYIPLAGDLENFLRDKYGEAHPDYDFNVEHVCDRWTFEAPEKIDPVEILSVSSPRIVLLQLIHVIAVSLTRLRKGVKAPEAEG
ncbi:Nn.00g101750.m01.CDS01 [Neocucurbitaria sp. VM-36]